MPGRHAPLGLGIGLLAALALATLAAPPARAGDWEDCSAGAADKRERVIAACTRLLDRAQLSRADRAKAYFHRAAAYKRLEDYDKSIADYTAALRLTPGDVNAEINRAIAYRLKGDDSRSVAELSRILEEDGRKSTLSLHGRFVAYQNRCAGYRRLGELDDALSDCNRAVRLKPQEAGGYVTRAFLHEKRSDYEKAIADYKSAIALQPDADQKTD